MLLCFASAHIREREVSARFKVIYVCWHVCIVCLYYDEYFASLTVHNSRNSFHSKEGKLYREQVSVFLTDYGMHMPAAAAAAAGDAGAMPMPMLIVEIPSVLSFR